MGRRWAVDGQHAAGCMQRRGAAVRNERRNEVSPKNMARKPRCPRRSDTRTRRQGVDCKATRPQPIGQTTANGHRGRRGSRGRLDWLDSSDFLQVCWASGAQVQLGLVRTTAHHGAHSYIHRRPWAPPHFVARVPGRTSSLGKQATNSTSAPPTSAPRGFALKPSSR